MSIETITRMTHEQDFPTGSTWTGRTGYITLFSADHPAGHRTAFHQFKDGEGITWWIEDLEGKDGRPMHLTDKEMADEADEL